MRRASPVEIRNALEAANAYAKAGILFVPVPVLDSDDHANLVEQATEKLDKFIALCDSDG